LRDAQVRREVLQLESEYDGLRRQLDQRQEELKSLKADKAQRRRELRGNDQTSGPMVELMQTLGQINKEIQEASAQALSLDEKLDEAHVNSVELEANEQEIKQEVEEVHAQRVAEEQKAADMQAKIVATQGELNMRDEEIRRIKRTMEEHAGVLGAHSGDHFHGQEKLAKDMGDLESLSAVIPHLDQDIREAEEILIQRNENLIARAHERDVLQQVLESLTMEQRAGVSNTYNSLDPQQNYEALLKEIERIREKATIVERSAEEKRIEELRLAKQRTGAEDEIARLAVEIEQLRRQLAEREEQIKALKTELEEKEHETATLEHSIEVKQEQLGKADQIEMWRMRRMLRRLEIKRQMRDKWKAEADKIAAKARQVEMEEMTALAAEAKSRDDSIKRRCDVYAMVPTLPGVTSSVMRSTTTTTTSFSHSVSSKGVTLAMGGQGDDSNYGTTWDPADDVRKPAGAGGARAPAAAAAAAAAPAVSASVRLDGGTISSLATHTNPEVRAAARRVQAMYHD
jgi:chromosome segregation ATPase